MTQPQAQRPLWRKILFHPMLYMSIVLHGLFFAIPGASEEEMPEELEEEQEIEITMLSPIVEAEPEPTPPVPPPQSAPQAAAPPAPAPQQAPPPEPTPPEPEKAEQAESQSEAEEPEVQQPEETQETKEDRQARIAGERAGITANLGSVGSSITSDLSAIIGQLPNNNQSLFQEGSETRPGIVGGNLLNNVKLQGANPNPTGNDPVPFDPNKHILPSDSPMQIEELPGQVYGSDGSIASRIFEIRNADGEAILYANAVPAGSAGASTAILLWEFNPAAHNASN
ncbi:MAG: hypothetical protein ACFB5Z_20150 [Elainellaceae cyanobacterium]